MSDAVVQMLVEGQNDLFWFESNKERLLSKYNNNFIAFHKGDVIDASPRLETLMKRLKDKNIDLSSLLIKFVSRVKFIL